MTRMTSVFILASLSFLGCSGSDSGGDDGSRPAPSAPGEVIGGGKELDIGDVEQGIRATATLSSKSDDAGVTNEEIVDRTKRVNLATVTVQGERESLLIDLRTESRRTFLRNPVPIEAAVRVEVTMPGEDTATISRYPLYKGIFTTRNQTDYFVQEFDVLENTSARPESVLAQIEITAIMSPTGTDPDLIDLDNFEGIDGQRTKVLGNPIRINFVN